MSDLREKLLKDKYREEQDIKNVPVIALLDISDDEFKLLKELELETIDSLANRC